MDFHTKNSEELFYQGPSKHLGALLGASSFVGFGSCLSESFSKGFSTKYPLKTSIGLICLGGIGATLGWVSCLNGEKQHKRMLGDQNKM